MLFDWLISTEIKKAKWRLDFEKRIYEIERKTGVNRDQLLRVAEVLDEMRLINPESANSPF